MQPLPDVKNRQNTISAPEDLGWRAGCALNGTLSVNTEYDQFGQPAFDLYTGTLKFTGAECPSTTVPDLPPEVGTEDPPDSPGGVIYAIEEPETSQHPDKQKLLVEAFSERADKEGCQTLEELDFGTVDISNTLDDSGFIGATNCPAAIPLNLKGETIYISFDPACTVFSWIGALVLISSGLIATKIVIGAF